MNKQQLAQKIWASANQMRSKIEANEYKDYILGFIFYKYLSDKEVSFLKENDYNDEYMKTVTEDDPETVKWVQENIGYFISYENLFSTWLELGRDFDVSNVRDALSAFSRLISNTHKRVFDKVFDTLQTGLSKLGDSSGTQTKAISGLLQLIKDIPMDGKQGYDVLGFIYEYLISMFAANAGKKAGEFYTPHEVSLLMSEIVASHLKGKNEIKIYDPTSGSGSLLINIGQSVAKYMSNDKKPAIRFKDYSDDWEQRKLGNMMDVTSVKRIHQSDWTDLGVRFLRARDIVAESKNEEVSEPLFISQEKYDEYSAVSGKVEKGDLLVTGVGTIGVPMLINSEEPLYFKDGNIIWFKNKNAIDGRFFYHSFKGLNIQKFIKESAGTGTVGTYTIENGKKTPINLPLQKEEQLILGA